MAATIDRNGLSSAARTALPDLSGRNECSLGHNSRMHTSRRTAGLFGLILLPLIASSAWCADYPPPQEADFSIEDFHFASGESLPELRMHYRTLGKPQRDAKGMVRNAVIIGHGTGGSGAQFIRPEFAGELFGAGQPLDATKFFIVLPDGIGHGKSSRPSDGLRTKFPRYGYRDMVDAQYRLLKEGFGVNHLRLVMGTSMGGMQSWVWGERYPDFMDALMPLASLPTQISGRNRVWRRVLIDAIRNDPAWQNGNYSTQPPSLRTAAGLLFFMGSNPQLRQAQMPTLAQADSVLDEAVADAIKTTDANDVLYQVSASWDYDPGPELEKIRVPLLAVNSADDLINPPELGILEREIKRVRQGRAIVLPLTPETRGHGTHTMAALWKQHLVELLTESAPPRDDRRASVENTRRPDAAACSMYALTDCGLGEAGKSEPLAAAGAETLW
jgi:homoserine O-acetyltransferase/O-succinyltransferase